MSASVLPNPVETMRAVAPVPAPVQPAKKGKAWLFGPWVDLFFLANLFWPIVVLAVVFGDTNVNLTISWWRLYFLLTPHRWITLVLVFFDPDRYQQQSRLFVGLALASILFCTSAYAVAGMVGVMVLLEIDFIWNAWHFASQHAGILRIYGRMASPDQPGKGTAEKVVLRTFLLYVLLRLACLALPHLDVGTHLNWVKEYGPQLVYLDLAMLLLPAGLVLRELINWNQSSAGRWLYLLSVTSLYSLLLWSANQFQTTGSASAGTLVMALGIGVSIFHATEYLAICTWAATNKRNPQGALGYLVPRWSFALVLFMGVLAISASLMNTWFATGWLLINLIISYLHYAYDGIIWKARKPAPRPAAV